MKTTLFLAFAVLTGASITFAAPPPPNLPAYLACAASDPAGCEVLMADTLQMQPEALYRYGMQLLNGVYWPKNERYALIVLQMAAKRGHLGAQAVLEAQTGAKYRKPQPKRRQGPSLEQKPAWLRPPGRKTA